MKFIAVKALGLDIQYLKTTSKKRKTPQSKELMKIENHPNLIK